MDSLPQELFCEIGFNFSPKDLCLFGMCCSYFYKIYTIIAIGEWWQKHFNASNGNECLCRRDRLDVQSLITTNYKENYELHVRLNRLLLLVEEEYPEYDFYRVHSPRCKILCDMLTYPPCGRYRDRIKAKISNSADYWYVVSKQFIVDCYGDIYCFNLCIFDNSSLPIKHLEYSARIIRVCDCSSPQTLSFPDCKFLDIYNTPITTVVIQSQFITILNIMNCNLVNLSFSSDVLPNLQVCILNDNNLEEVPKAILGASRLTILAINRNNLSRIPELSFLQLLSSVDFSRNKITILPDLSNLPNLKYADLRHNNISHLPNQTLQGCVWLRLTCNKIKTVSPHFWMGSAGFPIITYLGTVKIPVLNLTGNNLPRKEKIRLRKELESCRVFV